MVQNTKMHVALTIERHFCFLDAKFRNRWVQWFISRDCVIII